MKTYTNPFTATLLAVPFLFYSCKKDPTDPSRSQDVTAPVITISVTSPFTQALPAVAGSGNFNVPAATANDNIDGDVSSSIVVTSTVNPNVAGTYTVAYSATDAAGNTGSATLSVVISNSVSYLEGYYMNATDTCTVNPTSIFNATVAVSDSANNAIKIYNFGSFGPWVAINATVSGATITIPSSQVLGGGASIVSASGTVLSMVLPVRFKTNYIWSDGFSTVPCRSWYTRL